MKRVFVGIVVVGAALVGAGWSQRPRPASEFYYGSIVGATGRYAQDHGNVSIGDAGTGLRDRLIMSPRACHPSRRCLSLAGYATVTYTVQGHPIPDTGAIETIRGSGRVTPLGRVSVSGELHVPGNAACLRRSIAITLASAQGNVSLTARTQTGCPLRLGPGDG
jgi:hypothetical protein